MKPFQCHQTLYRTGIWGWVQDYTYMTQSVLISARGTQASSLARAHENRLLGNIDSSSTAWGYSQLAARDAGHFPIVRTHVLMMLVPGNICSFYRPSRLVFLGAKTLVSSSDRRKELGPALKNFHESSFTQDATAMLHSCDQSDSRFALLSVAIAWPCLHICACAVERFSTGDLDTKEDYNRQPPCYM